MDETATRKDIDEIIGILRDFMQQVDERFTQVDERFTQVDERFTHIDEGFTNIENEISELKHSHNRLLNTIDGFIARIDKYEIELAARDNQFDKLLAWARKVSLKTGIPLEDL